MFPARTRLRPSLACLALAAAGLALASAPAQAQDDYYYSSGGGYAPSQGYAPAPTYSAPDAYAPQYAPQPQHAPQPQYAPQTQYAPQYAPQAGYSQAGYAADGAYAMDDLTVRAAPRYRGRSSTTGAPIELVTAQRAVTYRDLDLTTPWGVDELNNRVKRAARSACRELDTFHPIAAADSPPCYSDAVASAMYQVRDAVGYAQPRW